MGSEEEEQLLKGIVGFSKSPGFAPCRTTGDSLSRPCVFCWGETWLIFLHFSTTCHLCLLDGASLAKQTDASNAGMRKKDLQEVKFGSPELVCQYHSWRSQSLRTLIL